MAKLTRIQPVPVMGSNLYQNVSPYLNVHHVIVIPVLGGGNSTVSRKHLLPCYHCSNLWRQEWQFILFILLPLHLRSCLSCSSVPILGVGNSTARRKPHLSWQQEISQLKLDYPSFTSLQYIIG